MQNTRLIIDECFKRGWSYAFLKKTERGHIIELSREANGKTYTYWGNLTSNGDINVLLNMADISFNKAVCYDEFERIDALIDSSANVVRIR